MSEMPELEGGDSVPVENVEAASAEVQTNESIVASTQLIETKRKKRVSVHWNRPKAHLYEYNYGETHSSQAFFFLLSYISYLDYGSNYYKVKIPKSFQTPLPFYFAETGYG